MEKTNNKSDVVKKYKSLLNEVSNKPWLIEQNFFLSFPWILILTKKERVKILTALLNPQCVTANPSKYRKLALFGLVFSEHINTKNILECCSLCINSDPKDIRNYLIRAYIYKQFKKHQEAINDINYYLKNGKEYGEIYRWRGQIFFEENKFKKSLSDFNRCIEIEPDNFMVYVNRGELYLKQKEFEKAKSDFEKHLSVFPKDIESILFDDETVGDPLSHIVCAYAMQGMDNEAKEYFKNIFKTEEYFDFELGDKIGPLVKKLADIDHHNLAYDFLEEYKDISSFDFSDAHKYVIESEMKNKYSKLIDKARLDERNKIIADLSHSLKNIVATLTDPLENLRQTKEYVDITIENALRGANLVREITNAMNYSLKGSVEDFYYDAINNNGHDSQTLAGMVTTSLRNSVANMFDTKYFQKFSRKYLTDKESYYCAKTDWAKSTNCDETNEIIPFLEKHFLNIKVDLNDIGNLAIGNDKGSAVKLLTIINEMILNAIKYSAFVDRSDRFIRIKFSGNKKQITFSVENSYKPRVKAKTTGMGHVILRNFAEMLNTPLEIKMGKNVYSVNFKIQNFWEVK